VLLSQRATCRSCRGIAQKDSEHEPGRCSCVFGSSSKMHRGERNAVIEPLIMVPLINSLLANPLLSLYKTGFDHPGGRGKLVNMGTDDPYPVIFRILVPVNLTACPYLTFTSRGVHNHPPPPPNMPPRDVVDSLVGVVRNMNQPGMTLGIVDYCKSQYLIRLIRDRTATFLKSPQLQEFCNQNMPSCFPHPCACQSHGMSLSHLHVKRCTQPPSSTA
jgi:hypothetical protein